MKLDKSLDKMLAVLILTIILVLFGTIYTVGRQRTYADFDGEIVIDTSEYYVNIYDGAERLIVRSGETTVGEILKKAGVVLNAGDIVEPSLGQEIDADNYYINIYRARAVIVKDGMVSKYLMIASYDPQTIVKEAGVVLYEGDEVLPVQSGDFKEVGMVEVYEVKRDEERLKREKELAEERAREEAEREAAEREAAEKARLVAMGARPLTARMGRNRYMVQKVSGVIVERQETYYDLPMSGVMAIAARECGVEAYYTVREDGVKVDAEGYVLVAANLNYYPRCSVVETSLGLGRVYDTGSFAEVNPEQFDLATDWTNRNGQ